jgi:hypothetical protein
VALGLGEFGNWQWDLCMDVGPWGTLAPEKQYLAGHRNSVGAHHPLQDLGRKNKILGQIKTLRRIQTQSPKCGKEMPYEEINVKILS